jgi:hypothetical protein
LAAIIIEEELELTATIVEEKLELVAPFLPINRHRERAAKIEQSESKAVENKRERGAAKGTNLAVIAAAASAAMRAGS